MTTSYRLPHLRYLQTKRLVAACIYVGLYYSVGVALLVLFVNDTELLLSDQVAWWYISFFIFFGIHVMWQLVRIAVAISSKWQWYDEIVVAQYQIDITPIEAVILLQTRSTSALAPLMLQSLLDKNAIRLVRKGRKIQVYDCYEDEKPLHYYEEYLTGLLLKDGASPLMSVWRLFHGRHIKQTEQHIYEKLRWRGYFAKQSPLQEGLGQYLRIGAYYMLFFIPLGIFIILNTVEPSTANDVYISQSDRVIAIAATVAVTLAVPLLVYVRSVFTRQGTERMSLALGFYWYLRTVYRHRLQGGYELSQSEEQQYGPYLDAFGLRRSKKVI